MGNPNSKPEGGKKSKKSKKNDDRKTSTPSPPRTLSKPIPASTTPPLHSSTPPVQSPITIDELKSSPSNGRRMAVAKPCTSQNTEGSMMVASSVSLSTSHTSIVSGLLHSKSTTYLPGSGNYQTMTQHEGRRTARSSWSSLGPRSFSLLPIPMQSSEPSIFTQTHAPHSSSGSQLLRREEFKNEDDDKREQPLEEPSDTAAITNETDDINEEPVHTEPAAVPICTEPIKQGASESNAPIFNYEVGEEEGFVTVDVPGIVPVEVKEGDNGYLEITIHKD